MMKKTILFITVSIFAIAAYAQGPVFMSPYKDGHAVPDSVKDYSVPSKVVVLNSSKKAAPVQQNNKPANQQPADNTNEKVKPVVLSAAKKP